MQYNLEEVKTKRLWSVEHKHLLSCPHLNMFRSNNAPHKATNIKSHSKVNTTTTTTNNNNNNNNVYSALGPL
jgi:hypothetical protein